MLSLAMSAPQGLETSLGNAFLLLGLGMGTVFLVLGALTGLIYLVGLLRERQPALAVAGDAPPGSVTGGPATPEQPAARSAGPEAGVSADATAAVASVALRVPRNLQADDDAAVAAAMALHLSGSSGVDDGAAVAAAVALHLGGVPGGDDDAVAAAMAIHLAGGMPAAFAAVPEPSVAGTGAWGSAAFGGGMVGPVPVLRRS